jgi:O-antigen ligase
MLIIAVAVLVPFDVRIDIVRISGAPVILQAFELPLAALALSLLGPGIVPRTRAAQLAAAATALLLGWTAVSLLVHPGLFGTLRLARMAGVAAFVAAVARTRWDLRALAAGAVLGVAGLESALAIAESALGHGLGYGSVGEREVLFVIGVGRAPTATFAHPYILASFAVVAAALGAALALMVPRYRRYLAAAALLAIVPVGLTFGREGALAAALLVATLAVGAVARRSTAVATVALALALGAGVAAAARADVWTGRLGDVVAGERGDPGGRIVLMRQALSLTGSHPLTGVGPARYVIAVADLPSTGDRPLPVHNAALLVAAESGAPAGLAFLAILVLLGVAATRGGVGPLAVYITYIPFLMFHHFPVSQPQGLGVTALWAAAVVALSIDSQPVEELEAP